MRGSQQVRKVMFAVVLGVAGAAAVMTPALAESAGGGTWFHGVSSVNYSHYFHKTLKHRASVSNGVYGVVRSSCVPANAYNGAYAEEPKASGGNQAFWSTSACN